MASADCATVAHRLTARWLKSGWQSASMSLDVLVGTKPCAYARNANCPECELPGMRTAVYHGSWQLFSLDWHIHTSPSDSQDIFSLR